MKQKSRSLRFNDAKELAIQAKEQYEELRDELQDWLDNMPENLQQGQKAEELQNAIDEIEVGISGLDEAESCEPEFPGMF